MAQKGVQLDQESFCCSICLDLLKDPTTISCGHSYCMNCIQTYWDEEDQKGIPSCPQCRKTFLPRPVLVKNIMLSALVEELRQTGLGASSADHSSAGPENVTRSVSTKKKQKSAKSRFFLPVSSYEEDLQPRLDAPPLKNLVGASELQQKNICSRHDEVMKVFCRTDQQCICYLCLMDEHKGHESVSTAAERVERQKELQLNQQEIQQRILNREEDVKMLHQEAEAIKVSADKTVEDSEMIFTELIRLIQKMSSDVKQQVRSQEDMEVSRVRELQENLEQEITELKRKDAELEQLSHTEDHNQFLHTYPSVSPLSGSTHSPISVRPLRYFEDVTAGLTDLRDKLQDILRDNWRNISLTVPEVDVLLLQPEPETRAGFLKYSREITLDPNTANRKLQLSEENRKATLIKQRLFYPNHPERFTFYHQILSKESLTGRCYWEVEWRGGGIDIAVSYKSIRRAGDSAECFFGFSDKSWALRCVGNSYTFWHQKVKTSVSGPPSSRIGVYLDHRAGILSFYSVSDIMTLLHRVQTTFTQPLHAGAVFYSDGDTAEFR